MAVWAVLRHDTTPEPQYKLQQDTLPRARCNTFSECVPFVDAEAEESDIAAALLESCESLTVDDLKALGFVDEIPDYFIVDHICTTSPWLVSDENPWGFGTFEPGLEACTDNLGTEDNVENPVVPEGDCPAGTCPDDQGAGDSGSSGGADSTGTAGDTETAGAAEFDCSPFEGLSYTEQRIRSRTQVDRSVSIERPLAEVLINQPYESLYFCGGALINSAMKIHTIERDSPLRDLGLAPDDTIMKACKDGTCSSVSLGVYDILAGPLEHGGDVELHILRGGSTTLLYTLHIRPPA